MEMPCCIGRACLWVVLHWPADPTLALFILACTAHTSIQTSAKPPRFFFAGFQATLQIIQTGRVAIPPRNRLPELADAPAKAAGSVLSYVEVASASGSHVCHMRFFTSAPAGCKTGEGRSSELNQL